MIMCFYEASLQLIISNDEAAVIFSPEDLKGESYVRITGTWAQGLLIYRSTVAEYNQRDLDGVFYKLSKASLTKGAAGIATIGWGILGPLKRADYVLPSRRKFDVEAVESGGVSAIKVPPLGQATAVTQKGPYGPAVGKMETVQRRPVMRPAAAFTQPVVQPPKPEVGQVSAAPTPQAKAQVPLLTRRAELANAFLTGKTVQRPLQQPLLPPPVDTAPPQIAPTSETISELKGLGAELNKCLAENPSLYVTVVDGQLRLEEEVVTYEEF